MKGPLLPVVFRDQALPILIAWCHGALGHPESDGEGDEGPPARFLWARSGIGINHFCPHFIDQNSLTWLVYNIRGLGNVV